MPKISGTYHGKAESQTSVVVRDVARHQLAHLIHRIAGIR